MPNDFQVKKFAFTSPIDGLVLQAVEYLPKNPKGIVQIVHGMCEYIERYDRVLAFLAGNGYVACGFDHRGHGHSAPSKDLLGYFGEDTKGKAIVQDTVCFTRLMKEKYPTLPVCLYGQSMGSMVSLCYLQESDAEIDRLILSGCPCKNSAAGLAVFLANVTATFKGEKHRSKLLKSLSLGLSEKAFPEDGKLGWLSNDKEVVEKYAQDEFCNYTFTVNGFQNLFRLLKNSYDKKAYKVKNPALPILFVAGNSDPIVGGEKRWKKEQEFLKGLGYDNVSGRLYEGIRHEPHNDLKQEELLQDLLAFLGR